MRLSQISISTTVNNDTVLDFNKALRRKLKINNRNTELDLNTICKYIQFKIRASQSSRVVFADDVLNRKDGEALMEYLNSTGLEEVVLNMTLGTYSAWRGKLKHNGRIQIRLELPTTDYEIYRTMYPNSKLTLQEFEDALSATLYDNRVIYYIPITTYNLPHLQEDLQNIFVSRKVPLVKLPQCNTYQEYALNSIYPTKGQLIEAISEFRGLANEYIIVENLPKCLFEKVGGAPSNVYFRKTHEHQLSMGVTGVVNTYAELARGFETIEKCETCQNTKNCMGMPSQYKGGNSNVSD